MLINDLAENCANNYDLSNSFLLYNHLIRFHSKLIKKMQPYFKRGIILYKQKIYSVALKSFEKALFHNSQNSLIYTMKSACFIKLLKLDEALINSSLALEKDAKSSYLYYNKGIILWLQKNYNDAVLLINKAIKLKKNNVTYYQSKAMCLISLEKYLDALLSIDKILKLTMNLWTVSNAYFIQGICNTNLNRNADAIESFNQSIKFSPNKIIAYNAMAYLLLSHGYFAESLSYLTLALQIKKDLKLSLLIREIVMLLIEIKVESTTSIEQILKTTKFYPLGLFHGLELSGIHLDNSIIGSCYGLKELKLLVNNLNIFCIESQSLCFNLICTQNEILELAI